MKGEIQEIFNDSSRVRDVFVEQGFDSLVQAVNILVDVLKGGNKILIFGNGGSAADAQHLAAEFINRYIIERPPLPAMALSTDSSVLTAIGNDYSYDEIFEKQIKALGKQGDAALGISTSGRSANVRRGLKAATDLGLVAIGIGGPSDSPMRQDCTCYIPVEGGCTPRIQEVHILIEHTIVEMVDRRLFGNSKGS